MLRRLFLGTSLALTGCAAFWQDIPAIEAGLSAAETILREIAEWAAEHPPSDARTAKAIQEALTVTSSALVAAQQALRGAKDVNDKNLQAAMAAFQDAYTALLGLVAELGVVVSSDKKTFALEKTSEKLTVPPASAFTLETIR